MVQDAEDQLLIQLLELQHRAITIYELKKTAEKVDWAKGFPESKVAFWNCAAFMWQRKIKKEKRELIKNEIQRLIGLGGASNLDIGSGSYSYVPSLAFDCSSKMLDFNDKAVKKVQGDLEEKWPFENNHFESVTAIFVLNYLSNLDFVLSELRRVLKNEGKFLVVLSASGVSALHKQQEQQQRDFGSWVNLLGKKFVLKESFEKEGLWFYLLNI